MSVVVEVWARCVYVCVCMGVVGVGLCHINCLTYMGGGGWGDIIAKCALIFQ